MTNVLEPCTYQKWQLLWREEPLHADKGRGQFWRWGGKICTMLHITTQIWVTCNISQEIELNFNAGCIYYTPIPSKVIYYCSRFQRKFTTRILVNKCHSDLSPGETILDVRGSPHFREFLNYFSYCLWGQGEQRNSKAILNWQRFYFFPITSKTKKSLIG